LKPSDFSINYLGGEQENMVSVGNSLTYAQCTEAAKDTVDAVRNPEISTD